MISVAMIHEANADRVADATRTVLDAAEGDLAGTIRTETRNWPDTITRAAASERVALGRITDMIENGTGVRYSNIDPEKGLSTQDMFVQRKAAAIDYATAEAVELERVADRLRSSFDRVMDAIGTAAWGRPAQTDEVSFEAAVGPLRSELRQFLDAMDRRTISRQLPTVLTRVTSASPLTRCLVGGLDDGGWLATYLAARDLGINWSELAPDAAQAVVAGLEAAPNPRPLGALNAWRTHLAMITGQRGVSLASSIDHSIQQISVAATYLTRTANSANGR